MISETEVREQFRRLKPLKEISAAQRGWTLDVLYIVRRLPLKVGDEVTSLKLKTGKGLSLLTSSPTREFTNEDVHAFARELGKLHPGIGGWVFDVSLLLRLGVWALNSVPLGSAALRGLTRLHHPP